jgi:hypothetical protein
MWVPSLLSRSQCSEQQYTEPHPEHASTPSPISQYRHLDLSAIVISCEQHPAVIMAYANVVEWIRCRFTFLNIYRAKICGYQPHDKQPKSHQWGETHRMANPRAAGWDEFGRNRVCVVQCPSRCALIAMPPACANTTRGTIWNHPSAATRPARCGLSTRSKNHPGCVIYAGTSFAEPAGMNAPTGSWDQTDANPATYASDAYLLSRFIELQVTTPTHPNIKNVPL